MISAALSLFLLRDLPLSAFEVPRRQTVGVLAVLGVLVGMSLASLTQDDGMPLMTIPQALLVGLGLNALLYGLVHGVLRWWLMRDGRWDGRGPLFNLLLAAGLVPNVLSALLESLELPAGIAQPLGLVLAVYGLWVVTRAIACAIPDAPPRYSLAGVALASVSSVLVLLVVATLATPLLVSQEGTALGGAPAGQQIFSDGQGSSAARSGREGTANEAANASAVPASSTTRAADCEPAQNYRQRPTGEMRHERFDRHGDPRREGEKCTGRSSGSASGG